MAVRVVDCSAVVADVTVVRIVVTDKDDVRTTLTVSVAAYEVDVVASSVLDTVGLAES